MLDLDTRDRAFIVAEAATGHSDIDPAKRFGKAMRLVEAAAKAGADAVKFQWFWTGIDNYVDLQGNMFCWIDGDEARAPRWRASVLSPEEWRQIKEFAEACGLVFLASTFQFATVSWLSDLDVAASKVASRAAKNFPYLTAPRPYLISTGMELPDAIPFPDSAILLQCEASYPSTTRWRGKHAGFSDHSGRPFLGIDAISRGCKLLEVHFKIDDISAGPDLPACLTLDELRLVCEARDYYAERAQQRIDFSVEANRRQFMDAAAKPVTAVRFDGSNDYLVRGGDLTGAVDGKHNLDSGEAA